MFIYSINDSQTFEIAKSKIELMMKKKKIIFLIGNKSYLESNRKILEKDAQEIVNKYNINFFTEISAKTGKNIEKMFYEAVKVLYKNKNFDANNDTKNICFSIPSGDYKVRKTLNNLLV